MDTLDERLVGLALCWLLTQRRTRGTRKKLEAALSPLVESHLGRARWKERFEERVTHLLREGLVTEGSRGVLVLEKPGHALALRLLSVNAPPRQLTWKKLQDTFLQALSLGLPTSRATLEWVGRAPGVRAAVLQREHKVEGERPTLNAVRDRLLWRRLGVETDRPFTLAAVQAHLLGGMLEQEAGEPRQAVDQLAARAVGATRADVEAVRIANLRAWLGGPVKSVPKPAPEAPPGGDAFAQQVLSVARALPAERRFGPNKVFIVHVWRALQPKWHQREAFNAALLEANRARHLSLSRADLVSVMDPTDVAESEVNIGSAQFHFVVV